MPEVTIDVNRLLLAFGPFAAMFFFVLIVQAVVILRMNEKLWRVRCLVGSMALQALTIIGWFVTVLIQST